MWLYLILVPEPILHDKGIRVWMHTEIMNRMFTHSSHSIPDRAGQWYKRSSIVSFTFSSSHSQQYSTLQLSHLDVLYWMLQWHVSIPTVIRNVGLFMLNRDWALREYISGQICFDALHSGSLYQHSLAPSLKRSSNALLKKYRGDFNMSRIQGLFIASMDGLSHFLQYFNDQVPIKAG